MKRKTAGQPYRDVEAPFRSQPAVFQSHYTTEPIPVKRKPATCRECRTVIKHGRCDCRQRVKAYLPSLEQIWNVETKAIQMAWNKDEEYNRRAEKQPRGWLPPVINRREVEESMGDAGPS